MGILRPQEVMDKLLTMDAGELVRSSMSEKRFLLMIPGGLLSLLLKCLAPRRPLHIGSCCARRT